MTPTTFDQLMRKAGYATQAQMAEALGVSTSLISLMISGKKRITERTETQVAMLTQHVRKERRV